jgi:hypothetical protein
VPSELRNTNAIHRQPRIIGRRRETLGQDVKDITTARPSRSAAAD